MSMKVLPDADELCIGATLVGLLVLDNVGARLELATVGSDAGDGVGEALLTTILEEEIGAQPPSSVAISISTSACV